MPVNFGPNRQGAAHIIEQTDVVLVRATPLYRSGIGTCDTRICIHGHGLAERAMWVRHAKHVDACGLKSEFHLWSYWLEQSDLDCVRDHLEQVAKLFRSFAPQFDGQDFGVSMCFWSEGERFTAYLHQPGTLRAQYSSAQVTAFENAYDVIANMVPQSTPIVDPLRP